MGEDTTELKQALTLFSEVLTLFSNKFLFWILVPLVFILSLIQPTIANGQQFSWPVNQPHTITQDYSAYNEVPVDFPNMYHTGIDLKTTNLEVFVATGGWVHDIRYNVDGWGNAIILRNPGGEYSLYAHLKEFSGFFQKGDWLPSFPSRTQLGIMGGTGNGKPDLYGIHLHFEIKSNELWGGGYTLTPPDVNGYFDPWEYIASTNISPVPVKVVNAAGLNVRRGPGTNYPFFTVLNFDQKFVAFAKSVTGNDVWYRIYLPCDNSSCAGWIAGTVGGTTYSVEEPSAIQVEVINTGTGGLFVRSSPDSSSSSLDKIWDGQRFVTFGTPQPGSGCSNNWYQMYLPAISGATSGWSCGDYLMLGDFNGDGTVNSIDWSIMNQYWGTSKPIADLNGDGIVNSIDWSIMNGNWGESE